MVREGFWRGWMPDTNKPPTSLCILKQSAVIPPPCSPTLSLFLGLCLCTLALPENATHTHTRCKCLIWSLSVRILQSPLSVYFEQLSARYESGRWRPLFYSFIYWSPTLLWSYYGAQVQHWFSSNPKICSPRKKKTYNSLDFVHIPKYTNPFLSLLLGRGGVKIVPGLSFFSSTFPYLCV